MAAHRYWRVFVTSAPVGFCALSEVRWLDASGARLTGSGTPFASSYYVPGGNDPTQAFDGNFSTFWASGSGHMPEWLAYDFGVAVNVAALQVFLLHDSADVAEGPASFSIQYSDNGSAWTTFGSYTPYWFNWVVTAGWSWAITPPAAGYYYNWRIKISATGSGHAPKVAELAMMNAVPGSTITSGGTPLAYDASPAQAFDSNPATYWDASAVSGQWLGYMWQVAQKIISLSITAPNDSHYADAPSAFCLEASNDGGTTWTTILCWSGIAWTQGQTQTFTLPAAGGGSYAFIL